MQVATLTWLCWWAGVSHVGLVAASLCGTSLHSHRGEQRVRSPWMALLFLRNRHTRGVHVDWVAGVVVGPTTIVTRGRQFWGEARTENQSSSSAPATIRMNGFKATNVIVGVGIGNRRAFQPDPFTQFLQVAFIRPHPNSFLEHSQFDFAVVQLKSNMTFSTKVHPICVPLPNHTNQAASSPSEFKGAPKRLSGFKHSANYSLLSVEYRMDGGSQCQLNNYTHTTRDMGDMFLEGSALCSWHRGAWYLTGLVTNSGDECHDQFRQNISPITASLENLYWIHANIRNGRGSESYTCLDGVSVDIGALCDGVVHCHGDGGSDEEVNFCEAWGCGQRAPQADVCDVEECGTVKVRNGVNSHVEVELSGEEEEEDDVVCPPLELTMEEFVGMEFQCKWGSGLSGSGDACTKYAQLPGARVRLSCLPQYKSTSPFSSADLICGTNGSWVGVGGRGKYFTCDLKCGVGGMDVSFTLTSRIVNGTPTEASNWPWSAAVFRRGGPAKPFVYICGATLISSHALLTVAHCVSDATGTPLRAELFRVVLMPTTPFYPNGSGDSGLSIASIHVHELYNPVTFEADVAILKTRIQVPMSELTYPACVPSVGHQGTERTQTREGSVGVVVGWATGPMWGAMSQLRQVKLPVVSVRECHRVLGIYPSAAQFCAGRTTGVGVCNGDSGTGILFQEGAGGLFYVQGIVSYGAPSENGEGCDYNKYSIFTRVAAFKEWIQSTLTQISPLAGPWPP